MDVIWFDVCRCVALKSEKDIYSLKMSCWWNYRKWFAIFLGDHVFCTTSFHITLWFVETWLALPCSSHLSSCFVRSISLSQNGWTHEAAWKTMLTKNYVSTLNYSWQCAQPPIAYLDLPKGAKWFLKAVN